MTNCRQQDLRVLFFLLPFQHRTIFEKQYFEQQLQPTVIPLLPLRLNKLPEIQMGFHSFVLAKFVLLATSKSVGKYHEVTTLWQRY